MRIIKNLVKRNKLYNELNNIEQNLKNTGYYKKQSQLSYLIYKPDEYAKLYIEIKSEYGILLERKEVIEKQLEMLSGINLFKNQTHNFTK